jgi:hypothetical protein
MLAVLAHTPVPGRHVAALLAVLLEARRHGRRCSPPAPAYLGGVWGVGWRRAGVWEETLAGGEW